MSDFVILKCSCGETYIGETIHNASERQEKHNDPTKNSEPAKHLRNNFNHVFNRVILCKTPQNYKVRRNLEASYIALLKPTLNEQKYFEISTLFRNFSYDIINLVVSQHFITCLKSTDNDVTHRKIFTISKILAIFIFEMYFLMKNTI